MNYIFNCFRDIISSLKSLVYPTNPFDKYSWEDSLYSQRNIQMREIGDMCIWCSDTMFLRPNIDGTVESVYISNF